MDFPPECLTATELVVSFLVERCVTTKTTVPTSVLRLHSIALFVMQLS